MYTTLIRLAAFAALVLCHADLVIAQGPAGPQRIDPTVRAQAQQLWDKYRQTNAGRAGGAELLAQVHSSRALPATKENAAAVLALLRSNVSRDEKVGLIRIAGAQVLDLEDQQARSDIQSFLSALAMSTEDPVIGKAAALMYSRMGYYPDSLAVLARAHAKGYAHDNGYFGDLAHLLPAAPNALEQTRILKLLSDGKNGFSREVLANLLLDRQILNSLAPAAASDAIALLTAHEPTFSSSTTTISALDAFRYADWMNAVVGLTARATGEPERVVMARLLKIDGANPKALIAVLHYEPNATLVRAGLDRRSIEKIDAVIASFAEKSKNDWVQELAALARTNLAEPKK